MPDKRMKRYQPETCPADTTPKLVVQDLRKRFDGEFELCVKELCVGSEEIVALLGPSGCGKTTCLRCIAGVETPRTGTVRIDDELVFGEGVRKPPEKRHVGMVYQDYAIWPHKSVYENVVFPLKHNSTEIERNEYETRVENILELLKIRELKESPATDLSGGQQQRTALARALVHEPDLLLLDEPLSNLDKELREEMRYEIQRLQHELNLSILYVTHNQEEAFYLADRVFIMNDGEIVEKGTPEALYRQPSSPFTRQFVGAHNRLSGRISRNGNDEKIVQTDLAEVPLAATNYVRNGTGEGSVDCFIHPEDFKIGHSSRTNGDAIGLSGTVIAEGLLGESREITVRCDTGDTELVVHTENNHNVDRGERLQIQFRPTEMQVYETES